MAEGARLESVFRGNSNAGSNPAPSAIKKLPDGGFFIENYKGKKCPASCAINNQNPCKSRRRSDVVILTELFVQ